VKGILQAKSVTRNIETPDNINRVFFLPKMDRLHDLLGVNSNNLLDLVLAKAEETYGLQGGVHSK
jgi:hypothetical protein